MPWPACTCRVSPCTTSMFSIGTCSTSAAICASDVTWPWPWLIEPEKIVTRPLELTLTRALSQPPRLKPISESRRDGAMPHMWV